MLKLVRNEKLLKQYPLLDDGYIEKMANLYTSEIAKTSYPNIKKIPFEEWLYQQYFSNIEKIG